MIPRLLVPGPLLPGAGAALDREATHYLSRVLRLHAGDAVEAFDGNGACHAAVLERIDARSALLRIGEALPGMPESPLRITLAQCISAGEKMDWTIEKAVELGAAAIVPLLSARSVVRLDADRAPRRAEPWQRLVAAACAQCGRNRLPALAPAMPLAAWLAAPEPAPGTDGSGDARSPDTPCAAGTPLPVLRLVLAPGAAEPIGRLETPAGLAGITLLVGPESGLAEAEVAAACAAGFRPVSLGPRILRTETAGLAALAILQARFGDLR